MRIPGHDLVLPVGLDQVEKWLLRDPHWLTAGRECPDHASSGGPSGHGPDPGGRDWPRRPAAFPAPGHGFAPGRALLAWLADARVEPAQVGLRLVEQRRARSAAGAWSPMSSTIRAKP